uniref:ARAD1C25542p n=1 Tax=Blastobotrys adeninivorans TaxID=409370 RepID=A0A060T217_BLAAD
MLSRLLVFLATLSVAVAFYASSPVVELTSRSWKKELGQSPVTVVEFYAPWCGHCRNLAPEYIKAAKKTHDVVKFAAIDCNEDANKKRCQKYGINSFPTIKVFRRVDGKTQIEDYNGPRTGAAIADFALSKVPSKAKVITEKNAESFVKKNKDSARVVYRAKKGTTSVPPVYKLLSTDFDKAVFGYVPADQQLDSVFKAEHDSRSSQLLFFGAGEGEPIVYDGEMKREPIAAFLKDQLSGKAKAKPSKETKPAKDTKQADKPSPKNLKSEPESQSEKVKTDSDVEKPKTEKKTEKTKSVDETVASEKVQETEQPEEPEKVELQDPEESETVESEEPEEVQTKESEPEESEPVESEPVESEPVESEPVESEPVESEPVESEPVESESEEPDPEPKASVDPKNDMDLDEKIKKISSMFHKRTAVHKQDELENTGDMAAEKIKPTNSKLHINVHGEKIDNPKAANGDEEAAFSILPVGDPIVHDTPEEEKEFSILPVEEPPTTVSGAKVVNNDKLEKIPDEVINKLPPEARKNYYSIMADMERKGLGKKTQGTKSLPPGITPAPSENAVRHPWTRVTSTQEFKDVCVDADRLCFVLAASPYGQLKDFQNVNSARQAYGKDLNQQAIFVYFVDVNEELEYLATELKLAPYAPPSKKLQEAAHKKNLGPEAAHPGALAVVNGKENWIINMEGAAIIDNVRPFLADSLGGKNSDLRRKLPVRHRVRRHKDEL